MNDNEIRIDIHKILENGDVKIYSDDGTLISLNAQLDDRREADEANDYIKAVEQDFRENADSILERLELAHLHIAPLKEKQD